MISIVSCRYKITYIHIHVTTPPQSNRNPFTYIISHSNGSHTIFRATSVVVVVAHNMSLEVGSARILLSMTTAPKRYHLPYPLPPPKRLPSRVVYSISRHTATQQNATRHNYFTMLLHDTPRVCARCSISSSLLYVTYVGTYSVILVGTVQTTCSLPFRNEKRASERA